MWTNRNGFWHTSINKKWTSKYIKPHRKRIGQSKPLESKCCWVQGLSFNDPKIVNQTEMGPASVYSHTWMPDVLRTSESLGPTLSKWVLICVEFPSNRNAALRWDEPKWSLLCLSFRKSKHVSLFNIGTLNDSENMTTHPDSYWTIWANYHNSLTWILRP